MLELCRRACCGGGVLSRCGVAVAVVVLVVVLVFVNVELWWFRVRVLVVPLALCRCSVVGCCAVALLGDGLFCWVVVTIGWGVGCCNVDDCCLTTATPPSVVRCS